MLLRSAITLAIILPALTQVTVDLSLPFAAAPNHNANPGAAALHNAMRSDIYGFAVIKNGTLVASVGPSDVRNVYSVTKTFVGILIGIMVQRGLLNLTTTLETALPTANWNSVSSANAKRAITIEQMLSMSSGLQASCFNYGPQSTVEAVLNSPAFRSDQVGRFSYLCSGSILSYVILRMTGSTPLAYANNELFPVLGITRTVTWTPVHGSDGVHETGHGLILGPVELAKLGQLYRQGGVTGSGEASAQQLIPMTFVRDSSNDQLARRIGASYLTYLGSACTFKSSEAGYGYMKWLFTTAAGQADCALGHQGQFICTWPDLDLVVAITSTDRTDYTSSCQLLDLVATGSLDFESRSDTQVETPPAPRSGDSTALGTAGSSDWIALAAIGGAVGGFMVVWAVVFALWKKGCFASSKAVERSTITAQA